MRAITHADALCMSLEELETEYRFYKWMVGMHRRMRTRELYEIERELQHHEEAMQKYQRKKNDRFDDYIAGKIPACKFQRLKRVPVRDTSESARRLDYIDEQIRQAEENCKYLQGCITYRKGTSKANKKYDPRKKVKKDEST